MKRCHSTCTFLFFSFTFYFHLIDSTYFNSILNHEVEFTPTSLQKNIPLTIQTDSEIIKKYTISGWMKNKSKKEGIINFLILKQSLSNSNHNLNSKFVKCPATFEEIAANPALKREPEIANNPNCFLQENSDTKQPLDYLFINFDLNPGLKKYSLVFLIQNGIKSTKSEMKIEGFADLDYNPGSWIFFAVSINYEIGNAVIHYNDSFKKDGKVINSKSIKLNFLNFEMTKENNIILANKSEVEYFRTETFFDGTLAYLDFSPLYIEEVEKVWLNYLSSDIYKFNGILVEFLFDIYENNESVKSKGELKQNFSFNGSFKPIYKDNKKKLGVNIQSNTFLDLKNFNLNLKEEIKPILFFFELRYKESLPLRYNLLERGKEGESGYLLISLIKENQMRYIELNANGGKLIKWKSKLLKPDENIWFLIGLVISPLKFVRVIYHDYTGLLDINYEEDSFDFKSEPLDISLFKQPHGNLSDNNGSLDLYRVIFLKTANSILGKYLIKNNFEKDFLTKSPNCELETDFFKESQKCLKCVKNFVLTKEKNCQLFCPLNFKNALNDVCVDCIKDKCGELDITNWRVEKLSTNDYKITPINKLYEPEKINFNELMTVSLDGKNKEEGNFEYVSKFNSTDHSILYTLDFKNKQPRDNLLQFKYLSDESKPLLDIDKNIIPNLDLMIKLENICIISVSKKSALNGLAITILVIFLLTFLILVLFTIFLRKKILNLGVFWKLFLHSWMNFQTVVFFLFFGVKMPCCVRQFLHILFTVSVKWNYALRSMIDSVNKGNSTYDNGLITTQPNNTEFINEDIFAFILHNFGLMFIFILIFILFYIAIKITSCFSNSSKVKNISLILDYNGIFVLISIFHMQLFVFIVINLKMNSFDNHYFVFCFLVSLIFILMLSLLFIYVGFRLFVIRGYYFAGLDNRKKFSHFFSGIMTKKWFVTFDFVRLIFFFLIAVVLGTAWEYFLFQTIFVFLLLLILLILAIILRPWIYTIQTIWEIISLSLLVLISIIFLSIAAYDQKKCYDCGDRESTICWFIVILTFLMSVGSCLFLLIFLALAYYKPHILREKDFQDNLGEKLERKNQNRNNLLNKVLTNNFQNDDHLEIENDIVYDDFYTKNKFVDNNREDFMKQYSYVSQEDNINYFDDRGDNKKRNNKMDDFFNRQYDNDLDEDNLLADDADEVHVQQGVIKSLINYEKEVEVIDDLDYQQTHHQKNQMKNFFDNKNQNCFTNPVKEFKSDEEDVIYKNNYYRKSSHDYDNNKRNFFN